MKSALLYILGCLLILPLQAFGQAELPAEQIPDLPQFSFDALNFSSGQQGTGRLDVYIEVPYEVLHFIKDEDLFRANYEAAIDLYDSTDTMIDEKTWTEKVETKKYDESISPKAVNLTQKSFVLASGHYAIAVQVRDNETKKSYRLKRPIIIRDFSVGPIGVSDIMLVKKIGMESAKKTIYPNISGNVGELTDGFYLFFEVYNHSGADSGRVGITVQNLKGTVIQGDSLTEQLSEGKKSIFVNVKTSNLSTGDYIVEAQVQPFLPTAGSRASELSAVSSRTFMIRWKGMPVSLLELKQAIDQLQYITEKDKIDEMRDAPEEKRRELFQEFWKKKDPTPNTERNELMEEYYGRVDYANKHFGHYTEGWKTDMGMVYIVFGAPNNIERHPFDIDSKPFEVWTYYEANREFVFIDATGFGDYKLQNPIWDIWRTRPR